MNKLTNNIPNRIKQPAQCCVHCGKSYIKRANLDKHLVICELLQQSKKKSKIIIEEDEPMPSQRKMFEMLLELGQKYSRLEEKVEELNKWVVKKKKKINILEWLNTNIKPDINFDNIIDKIIIDESDIKCLLDNTFYDVLNEVFSRTIYKFSETENPIFAFVQKQNMFYIYDKDNIWVELSRDRLIKFLNKVHTKIFKQFYEWKKSKAFDIKSDDRLATLCDKTLVKITSIEFNQESILSKVKNNMFSRMKTDMKALVEYEFEF
jgi:uncharacterized protein YeeX (DUF496 family)